MCSAIPRRIAFIGSSALRRSSAAQRAERAARPASARLQRAPVRRAAAEPAAGAALVRRAAARPARRPARPRAGLRADSMKARMSFFVTRPPRPGALRPGPGRRRARRRCARRPARRTSCRSPDWPSAAGCRRRGGSGRRRRRRLRGRGDVADALARRGHRLRRRRPASRARAARRPARAPRRSAPSGAITASIVPTSTVSPSWTRIFVTTPAPGLGTSVSTLSVEISSSGSSAAIVSPSDFSHFVIVPSETETPICGMTTSICVSVAMLSPSRRRARGALRRRPRPAG